MDCENKNIEKLDFDTIEHEEIPYTVIHTKVIQTITDHFAGFIWVYLQSLPRTWKVNKTHLQKHFNIGADKLKKHLAYLNRCRLIEYVRYRTPGGTLGKCRIRVLNGTNFDVNSTSSPGFKTIVEGPSTGVKNHLVDHHTTGKSVTINTINTFRKSKEDLTKTNVLSTNNYKETYFPLPTFQPECNLSVAHQSFEEFWNLYPIKKGKKSAIQAWEKKACYLKSKFILEKLKMQIEHDSQFIMGFAPHPTTYINQERWEDEIQQTKRNTGNRKKDLAGFHKDTSYMQEIAEWQKEFCQ